MANTALTRPVVTMDLANRSIGRVGLLANRVMHPLVSGRFGREVGMLAKTSDVNIQPDSWKIGRPLFGGEVSWGGCTAHTEYGETPIKLYCLSDLLALAGVLEIEIPKGTSAAQIGNIFRALITRTPAMAEKQLENIPVVMKVSGDQIPQPFLFFNNYRISRLMNIARTATSVEATDAFDKLDKIGIIPEQLDSLSRAASGEIRNKVAQHPRTSDATLIKMAKIFDHTAAYAFDRLNNQGLSLDQLLELSNVSSRQESEIYNSGAIPYVLEGVIKHPKSTPQIKSSAILGVFKGIGWPEAVARFYTEYHDTTFELDGRRYVRRPVPCTDWVQDDSDYYQEVYGISTLPSDEFETQRLYSSSILKHALDLFSLVDKEHQALILTELTASYPELVAELRPLINLEK